MNVIPYEKTYKVLIVGDAGVGKSTYIRRHLLGNFEKRYLATIGVEVHPLRYTFKNDKNIKRTVCFNCWDCAGDDKFRGHGIEGYGQKADCAIVMYNDYATNDLIVHSSLKWIKEINDLGLDIPIILVSTKADWQYTVNKTKEDRDYFLSLPNVFKFIDTSSKTCYNFDKPFLYLVRKLTGDDTLRYQ